MGGDDRPIIERHRGHRWRNWHYTVERELTELIDVWNGNLVEDSLTAYNGTTRGLQNLIADALAAGQELRALGRGWSFSPVAATQHRLLNTKPLNYVFSISPDRLHPSCPHDASDLVLAQCGASVARLNQLLRGWGKALRTSGASNGQTIAGAIATDTHGSAIDFGPMAAFVAGIHLVVSPERHIWLERATRPTLSDDIGDRLGGAEVVRDDRLFESALVSFGSFGLIHSLLLEIEDLYYLQAWREEMELSPGLWRAIDELDFADVELPRSERPFHFEVLFSTVDRNRALVTTMYKRSERDPEAEPPPEGDAAAPGHGVLELASAVTDRAGVLIKPLNRLTEREYPTYSNVCGRPDEIFPDPGTRAGAASVGEGALLAGGEGPAVSAGIGLPLGRVREAVDVMQRALEQEPAAGLIALRYVRGGTAVLGFTKFEPHTCVLEFNGPASSKTEAYLQRVWSTLRERDIPHTIHWGKAQDLDASAVRIMYGYERVDAWILARRRLLDSPALRRVFSNDWLRMLELAS